MADWASASTPELLHALSAAQHRLNAEFRDLLHLVAEVTRRGVAEAEGFVDEVRLVQCAQNVTRTEAKRRLAAAEAVTDRRTLLGEPVPAALPATAAAVAEAAISAEHVAVIQQTLAGLPPHLDRHREELEEYLAGHARTFDPAALRLLGRRRVQVLDPDGLRPADGSPKRDRLSLVPDGDGVDVSGWLSSESAAVLGSALSPLAAPEPADAQTPDPRSRAERQADALVELARRALDGGGLGTEAGVRPHVTVTVPLTVLEERVGAGLLDFADGDLPGVIDAETARRYACDAHLAAVVIGGKSEPLDIGRACYTVPRGMRRALKQRDGGCAFPGCTVPRSGPTRTT